MKFLFVFLFFIFSCGLRSHAQPKPTSALADTVLAGKLTISGFCLCQTTLTGLKNLDDNLKEVEVEEMDMCRDGFVQDGRYVNRKGYYSEKFPGMIFQKDDGGTDFISKIRLTKDFAGKLPDGTPIDMHKLFAKDVIKLYPSYANTWKSRGCSDYWSLTNDTLSFFVRIDKNKKTQYPVDEAYYAEKPIEGVDLVVSCYNILANNRYKQLFEDPVFFVDSVNVTRIELQKYKPADIASVTVYKDTNAIKLVGPQGKYGAVYIETKRYARNKYWSFFKNRSGQYLELAPTPEADTSISYILNGKVLTTNFESNLSAINDTDFIELIIISKEQLIKDFGITDKKYGVLIKTKTNK